MPKAYLVRSSDALVMLATACESSQQYIQTGVSSDASNTTGLVSRSIRSEPTALFRRPTVDGELRTVRTTRSSSCGCAQVWYAAST